MPRSGVSLQSLEQFSQTFHGSFSSLSGKLLGTRSMGFRVLGFNLGGTFHSDFPGTYRRNFTSDAEWSKTPDLLHPHFKFGEGRTLHAAGGRKSSMFFLPASIARISSASDGI